MPKFVGEKTGYYALALCIVEEEHTAKTSLMYMETGRQNVEKGDERFTVEKLRKLKEGIERCGVTVDNIAMIYNVSRNQGRKLKKIVEDEDKITEKTVEKIIEELEYF